MFKWHYFDQVYSRFTRDGKMAFFTSQTRPLRRKTLQWWQPEVFLAVISLPLAVTDACRRRILSRLLSLSWHVCPLLVSYWPRYWLTCRPNSADWCRLTCQLILSCHVDWYLTDLSTEYRLIASTNSQLWGAQVMKDLNNSHFLLSPRWPLWIVSGVFKNTLEV